MSYKTETSSSFCMHEKTAPSHLFISCADKLEELLKDELKSLGISDVRLGYRGLYAPNTLENIFKINYLSRLATRVLLPIAQFPCPDARSLYNEACKISWLDYLDETKTFAIDANIKHPDIRHSLYGAQLLKDAICDEIRKTKDARPDVNVQNPDVQLNLFIQKERATISIDTSGTALYKRGWRESSGEAGLSETLAAAILRQINYSEREILCDPFCGDGTFLMEAAMMLTQTPAGYFRNKWGFMHLPQFSQSEWEAFKAESDGKRKAFDEPRIFGSDSSPQVVKRAKQHMLQAGFEKQMVITHAPVDQYTPSRSPTLIVTDPPFGKRLQADPKIYQDFGKFLKTRCPVAPWGYLLTSSFHFVKATGCSVLSEWPLFHGGLNVGLYQLKSS